MGGRKVREHIFPNHFFISCAIVYVVMGVLFTAYYTIGTGITRGNSLIDQVLIWAIFVLLWPVSLLTLSYHYVLHVWYKLLRG
jgi:hypothetical protein